MKGSQLRDRAITHSLVRLLHGLVQTEDYARALYEHSAVPWEELDITKNVRFRMERQQSVLGRDVPPELHIVVSAGALSRRAGGRDGLRKQVEHLVDMEDRGAVVIRVLPWDAGPALIERAFTLLDFDDVQEDPSVAYVEVPGGARYLETEPELSYYRTAWAARRLGRCQERRVRPPALSDVDGAGRLWSSGTVRLRLGAVETSTPRVAPRRRSSAG